MKKVMMTGTFDLFHAGHLSIFKKAHEIGDVLYVGVNSDARVRLKKGNDRPIFPLEHRLDLIRANQYVAEAIPIGYIPCIDGDSSERGIRLLLERWEPDIWLDGAHRSAEKNANLLSQYYPFTYLSVACEVIHTTDIIEKIRRTP